MKLLPALFLLLLPYLIHAQYCGPITAGASVNHGKLKHNILRSESGNYNQLFYKTAVDEETGDKAYVPLINSMNKWRINKDPNNNVKMAIGKYEMQDWNPGPLDINGQTDSLTCVKWDKIFSFTNCEVRAAIEMFENEGPCDNYPENIKYWPAKGNPFLPDLENQILADFYDHNNDGIYNPCNGDLPFVQYNGYQFNINVLNSTIINYIPSQVHFWIMNDNGNFSIIDDATPTRTELHTYAFTIDSEETEDMIFFKYMNFYKGSDSNHSTVGNWFDFDIGCPENDLLGYDHESKTIYAYNDTLFGNGCQINNNIEKSLPSIGLSYLVNPLAPFNIISSSSGEDSLITPPLFSSGPFDTLAQIQTAAVTIPYNCNQMPAQTTCSPISSNDYFNVFNGRNTDGSPILNPAGDATTFMFDGDPTDPLGWSFCTDDAALKTTATLSLSNHHLSPGAIQHSLLSAFLMETPESKCQPLGKVRYRRQKVKKVSDYSFFHQIGPDAPDLEAQLEDGKVYLTLSNIPYDYQELELDATEFDDKYYKFEGVKIYQVKHENFEKDEINNVQLARLVYQGDLENDVDEIFNWVDIYFQNQVLWYPERRVDGANEGIVQNIVLEWDAFSGNPYDSSQDYYFYAVSYGYNNFEYYSPIDGVGQKYPYIEGNCNTAIVSTNMSTKTKNEVLQKKLFHFSYNDNTIEIKNLSSDLTFQLFGIDGRKYYQFDCPQNSLITTFPIQNVNSGVYILYGFDPVSGNSQTEKIVVF